MGAYRRDREASSGFCSGRLSNQRTEISSGEEVAQRGIGGMIDPIEGAVAQVIVMAIATTAKIIQTAIKRIMEKIQRRRYQIIPQK